MRRKQVAQDLENDPLISFGEQLGGERQPDGTTNAYGETRVVLKQSNINLLF